VSRVGGLVAEGHAVGGGAEPGAALPETCPRSLPMEHPQLPLVMSGAPCRSQTGLTPPVRRGPG
jgi:hypothetical protein